MKWYKFESLEAFNIWHDEVKQKLGYPLPSIDSQGNVLGEPFTTEYTSVVEVAANDWRTVIDKEHADGLTESSAPIIADERYDQANA